MPFPILGSNSAVGEYEIENSLIFNGANQYLSRTPSSAGNRRTFTTSWWNKIKVDETSRWVFGAGTQASDNDYFLFQSGHLLKFSFATESSGNIQTTQVFRDPAAWQHIVWAVDTTQSTASNRVKLYVNGSQVSSFGVETYPSQNYDTSINNTVVNRIGGRAYSIAGLFAGYMAEFNHIDGQQLAPTEFAETNENGVWVPKKYSGTYGTNGFFLEFKQSGTSADASGIGADTSGNGNHFSVNALGSNSTALDTPTNNFATLNPLDVRQGASFGSSGNLNITTNSTNRNYVISTIGVTKGKWYCEARITSGADSQMAWFGVADFDDLLASSSSTLGDNSNEVGFNAEGGYQKNNSNTAGFASSIADNDIVGILLDMDNNRVTHHKNGSYADGSGNYDESSPTAYVTFSNSTMGFAFGDGGGGSSAEFDVNFGGAVSFNVSSANSDANGYGKFEYAVPSGYYALCTKNLAEYG